MAHKVALRDEVGEDGLEHAGGVAVGEGAGGGDLIQIRAERLLALGYPGDAAALRALAPTGGLDAAAAGRLADAWLLAGEPGRA